MPEGGIPVETLDKPKSEHKDTGLDGLFFKPENIGWALVIKGYFDESFDERSGSVWVAGHLGDESAWKKYVIDWKQSLGDRQQLHMSDLRWAKPYTRTLLSRLGPIPAQSGLRPFVSGVRTSDIADLVAGTRLEHYSNGYILSLIEVTCQAVLSIPDGEYLEVVFEDRDQTRAHARDALFAMHIMPQFANSMPQLLISDGSTKLAKYGFMQGSGTVLFDQADYLCYSLLQQHRDRNSERAGLCRPILEWSGVAGDGFMDRDEARNMFTSLLTGKD
jgi:hypothetical protein